MRHELLGILGVLLMIETSRGHQRLNLTDYASAIPDLNNILNGGFNVQAMLGWLGQLNERCKNNGVKMNLNLLVMKILISKTCMRAC